jgi:trimeric autotransporter adhesin
MTTSSPTGAQDPPTLSFGSTSPVDITGVSSGTGTLTISTTAATSGALEYPVRPGVRWNATSAGLAFALVFGMGPARRRNWRTRLGLLVFLVALIAGSLACGSGGSGGGGHGNPGTTVGTYTLTVTGSSGNTTATGTVTLTVQ